MKKLRLTLQMGALLLSAFTYQAHAHDNVSFSVNLGGPAYYAPAPVYVTPAPVYYAPPTIYYRAEPVYYSPTTYFSYIDEPRYHDRRNHGFRGHGLHRGWHNRHHHEED